MAQKEEKVEVIKKALVIEPIKNKKGYQYRRAMMVYDEAVKLLKNSRK